MHHEAPRERYLKRAAELRSPEVSVVLEAAGDLLRRRRALGCDLAAVERALHGVADAALTRWRTQLELGALEGHLRLAAAAAVAGVWPEPGADAEGLSASAMEGLRRRDRLESALAGLERLEELGREHAGLLARALRVEATALDRVGRAMAVSFTPLNSARRAEAALLDEPGRWRAWWFSSHSGVEDDLLVLTLGGAHQGTLAPEQAGASELVSGWPLGPVSSEALLRLDLGLASEAEARAITHRSEREPELALALAAMQAGETAIEAIEATGHLGSEPLQHAPLVVAPRTLHQHQDFTVLLFRGPQRVRMVIEPRRQGGLVAATLRREGQAGGGLRGTSGPSGLEFELPGGGQGWAQLEVELKGGARSTLSLDLA